MLRLGTAISLFGIVALLFATGGVAANEVGVDTAPEIETTNAQSVGTVEVIVVDQSGNGIGNVEVTASWDDGEDSTQTTSSGRALLDVPTETEIEFTVEHLDGEYVKNHQPVSESNVVGEVVTIEMAEPGDAQLEVVDSDEQPVDDVRLRLYHEGDNSIVDVVYTDSEGIATFTAIEQRAYDVDTLRAGYNVAEANFTLDSAETSETIEIESNRVEVSFLVTDDHFEEPERLQGATIDIAEFGTLPPTFSDGTQDQSLPVNDEYDVTVSKEGYDAVTETLEVGEEPTALNVSIQRTPEINIEQLQDAVVVGQTTLVTITNAYDEPVAGASVSLNGESVGETDEQGQIFFNVTSDGINDLDASYQGLSASDTIVGVEPSEDTPADPEEQEDADDAEDDEQDDTEDEDDEGPGFGILAAVGAVLALTAFLARRR